MYINRTERVNEGHLDDAKAKKAKKSGNKESFGDALEGILEADAVKATLSSTEKEKDQPDPHAQQKEQQEEESGHPSNLGTGVKVDTSA